MRVALFLTELRLALRGLLRRPGFTASAIVTLALGLGASVAIFSVADAVLLHPLPYAHADRLVRVVADNPEIDVSGAGVSLGDFADYRSEVRAWSALAAYTGQNLDLAGPDGPQVVRAARVSPNLFRVLGSDAAVGRTLLLGEEGPEDRVVVISHAFWQSRFAGRAEAVGSELDLDGHRYEVVGVMPSGFAYPNPETRLWVPLVVPATGADRWSHYLGSVGRLAPGADVAQATRELARLSAQLRELHPDSNHGWQARAVRLTTAVSERARPAVLVLCAAVGLLLVIACANVAALLLVRGVSRSREAAICSALGAPRLRMAHSLLLESLILSVAGGALGVFLAHLGIVALATYRLQGFPQYRSVALDGRALAVALFLVAVTAVVSGLWPAFRLAHGDVGGLIKQTHGTGGREAARLRGLMVVVEIALALVLLIGASLMLRSFRQLDRVDPGFDPRQVLVQRIALSPERYPDVPRQVALFEGLLDRVRALPGVESVAAVSAVPLHPAGQNLLPFEVRGVRHDGDGTSFAVFSSVSPGTFHTLRVPLLHGRDFTRHDDVAAPPVLIVDETLARRFWPHGRAVGKQLVAIIQGTTPETYEIVGVVGAVRSRDLAAEPEMAVYAPYRQVPPRQMAVVTRTAGDALGLAEPVRRLLLALDPGQPILETTTLADVVDGAQRESSLYAWLLGVFATIGLLLAGVGIYGVVAYSFAQRHREMAVRVALGARSATLFRLVLGAALRLTAAGIALGWLVALLSTRWLSSVLYGVRERDPLTFAAVPLLVLAVALLASLFPARRVLQLDPSHVLRQG